MITVWGEGRGFRVVWLLEEMGLPYRLRQVDLLADVTKDTEFLAVNPAGFIPAITDGAVTMVESIAIMQYLMTRHGPTHLSPAPQSADFPTYLQFLHLGEAGLAVPVFFLLNARRLPTEAERQNPTAAQALRQFWNRMGLVRRQLGRAPHMAGEDFTAADISVAYALELAQHGAGIELGAIETTYLARVRQRPGYQRAMDMCPARKAWFAATPRT